MKIRTLGTVRHALATSGLVAAAFVLSGCATGYEPMGTRGGYREIRVTDRSYIVEFAGNDLTSKEIVWNFWVYRCAELTRERGFAYFAVEPKGPAAQGSSGSFNLTAGESVSASDDWTELKGGGSAPIFIYSASPGYGPTTRWHSKGTIVMFRTSTEPGARLALNASAVIASLTKFMRDPVQTNALTPDDIVRVAMAAPSPPPDLRESAVPLPEGGVGGVQMKDLSGLLR